MQEGDVVTATFTIEVPGVPGTKAATSDDQEMVGDGRAADNLVFAVFDETGAELPDLRQGDWMNKTGDNRDVIKFDNSEQPKVTVTVKLVRGKEYSFVCWAQNEAATCYNFEDMKNIGISYADYNASNNDLRDAFYAYAQTNGPVTENFSQTIELERPFAQINVGTTDFVAAQKAGLEIKNLYSTMTVKNAATSLETFTGKTSGSQTVTFTYAHAVAPDHDLEINKNKVVNNPNIEIADKYGWLAMNYILVADGTDKGTSSALAEVSFQIREGDATILASYDVPNVPVQRNFRSNIVGGLLTAEGTINVIIDPIFNGEYVVNVWDGYSVSEPKKDAQGNYLVTKPEELAWFQKNTPDANIYLVNDIDLAGHPWTPIAYFNGEKVLTFEGLLVTKAGETYPTIYGLNIHQTLGKAAGLFGGVTFNFKNFNIDGASCNCASSFVGAVAGQVYGDLENISVKNVSFVADPSRKDIRYGAIAGMHNAGNATGCSVENAVVKAYHNVGGICGTVNESNKNRTYRDCSVKNSTFELYCTEGAGAKMVGALTGNANAVTLYYENCTAEGNNVNTLVGSGEAVDLKVPVLTVVKTAFEVEYEATQVEIQIESNIAWTVAGEGVKAEPEAGEGNAKVVLTFAANEAYEAKTYEVTVASEAEVEPVTVTITQGAAPEPEPEFVVATVAEFLAAAEDDTVYQLTGVITSVTNTSYGNFYLKDETGEVLIYGLCSPEGEQKYWAASGAKVGDTITVQTVRSSYNGAAQGKNAIFVKLTPFVAQASEWGVVGDLTGWGNTKDIVMYTTWHTKNLFVAYNVEIASGAFKIRANNQWNDAKNYGLEVAGNIYADSYYKVISGSGSQNATPMTFGTYDVYFDLTNKRVALMTPGTAYAEAKDGGKPVVVVAGLKDHEWGVVGSFQGWDPATGAAMVVDGDWAVAKNVNLTKNAEFKFAADKAWTLSYGSACDVNVGETYTTYNNGGNMKFVGEAGAYDIYFSLVNADFYMEKHVEKTEVTATLTFDTLDKRTSKTTEQAVWEENGIIVTNDKAKSATAIADYCNPARFYQNSNLTVAVDGEITSIVFDCNSSSYATELANTLGLKADSDKVTVNLDTPSATYVVENLNKQVRMDAITVTYNK